MRLSNPQGTEGGGEGEWPCWICTLKTQNTVQARGHTGISPDERWQGSSLHLTSNMHVQTAHPWIYKTGGILSLSGLYANAHGLWLTQSTECTNCEVTVV